MIIQLLDDYDDIALRSYGERNLRYIKSLITDPQMTLSTSDFGHSPIGIQMGFTHSVCSRDVFMQFVTGVKHTEHYFNQTSEEIYEEINRWMNIELSRKVFEIYRKGPKTPKNIFEYEESPRNRFQLYTNRTSQTKLEDLRFPCKDLLLLSIIAQNITLMLSNKELIEFCQHQKEEFIKLTKDI